mmetsp:Transcript_33276/g.33894  ORF Transcript_33276/g.33894 Transcript_33276/m.33894 type:complete len:144 (+) Transcript_33276:200-631(+)
MSSDCDDLSGAVRQRLETKGVIHEIKARIRAEIFHTMEDKSSSMPEKPADVFIAFELVKEFLDSFHLHNTLSVFVEECGQPTEMRTDREFVANELGFSLPKSGAISEKEENIPLLISLVQILQKQRIETQNKLHSSMIAETDS